MPNCNVSIFGPEQHLDAEALYKEALSKPTRLGASISGPVEAVKIKRPDTGSSSTTIANVAAGSYVVVIWDKLTPPV